MPNGKKHGTGTFKWADGSMFIGEFYNNNIHPYQEFQKRLEAVREYSRLVELNVQINETYMLEEFLKNVAIDPANRCSYCYQSTLT